MKTEDKKIYSLRAIAFGTMLGSLPVTGYMLVNNFNAFGEGRKASAAWFCSITATLLLLGLSFYLPDGKYLSLFPLMIAGSVYYIVQSIQGKSIDNFIQTGGKEHSRWNRFVVSFTGLTIVVLAIIGFVYLAEGAEYSSKTYGAMQHEILFKKDNLPATETDKLAQYLTRAGFFDDEFKKAVLIEKIDANYEIYISISQQAIGNNEAYAIFRSLQNDLQTLCIDHKIVLKLILDADVNNVILQIE